MWVYGPEAENKSFFIYSRCGSHPCLEAFSRYMGLLIKLVKNSRGHTPSAHLCHVQEDTGEMWVLLLVFKSLKLSQGAQIEGSR